MLTEHAPWKGHGRNRDAYMPYAFRSDQAFGRGGLWLYQRDWMTETTSRNETLTARHESKSRGRIPMIAGSGSTISLSGIGDKIKDFFGFQEHWNVVREWAEQWNALGNLISEKQQKLGQLVYNLLHPKYGNPRPDVVQMLQSDIDKVNADMQQWWVVKGYIDKYLPEWKQQASQGSGVSGLGLVPLVLGASAIAGLSFVAVQGLRIWKEYSVQSHVLDAVKSKEVSSDAGQVLMQAAEGVDGGGSLMNTVGASLFGLSGGVGLAAIGIVGLYIYVNFFRRAA